MGKIDDAMPAVTADEFLAEYPRFNVPGITPEYVQTLLNRCERKDCPLDVWEDDQRDGIMLLTAHLLDMEFMQAAKISGLAAQAAQGQAGQLSGTGVQNHLQLTIYGQQWEELRNSLGTTIGGMAFGGGASSLWTYGDL